MTVLDGDPGAIDARLTPLRVANARAEEVESPRPLFTDPYARLLVEAAGSGAPELPWVTSYVAARTKWFDDFFLAASSAGVSQVVIVGSALDTRAWRLPWLSDTVIYEVERPALLEFKQRVVAGAGASPAARHVPVPSDLRDDWPRALIAAGFDAGEPTVWAVEGLLPGLSVDDQEHLLDRIDLYSARGSRIGIEALAEGPDHACWLCARMWEMNATATADLMERYHRALPAEADDPATRSVFLDGRKL
ncbi:SAM-dependent methyltransferase [Mycobacterium sp. 4D054]|uniref:SAM-dependent methyltransferase n=1 Tax=Mycobacterium sp. 4D054 TaxID=3457440 RepID=UPI003FD4FFED